MGIQVFRPVSPTESPLLTFLLRVDAGTDPRRDGRPRGGIPTGAICACLALFAVSRPATAQEATPGGLPECSDGAISEVAIEGGSVFEISEARREGRLGWAYGLANRLHIQTRPEVIERELLFRPGDCYDVELLRDSERLLRAFDFLADADVYGIRQPDGTVRVVVDTRDEWSARVEPQVGSKGSTVRGLRLVEDNLLGTGRHLGLYYEREAAGTIFGGSYSAPQLFRTRSNLALHLARTEAGHSYGQFVSYPFVGEVGGRAFLQGISRDERYFDLMIPGDGPDAMAWVPVTRERAEVGVAIRRRSVLRGHTILGAGLAAEKISYEGASRFPENDATQETMTAVQELEWTPFSSVRAVLFAGQRNVYFVRRRALDTINGTEDVPLGLEAEISIGPTLPALSEERDVAFILGLSAAGQPSSTSLLGGQFSFEARRSHPSERIPEWNDVMTELDGWIYFRPATESSHTWVAGISGAGGWHVRAPFQLTLGGETGLRGYSRHMEAGGRRAVASVEHRAHLGWPLPELFDLGSVAFLDVGRIWAGEVPFGADSPVRASAGIGIRAAFPPGSRQTFRMDVALPVHRGTRPGNVVVSIGVGQAVGRQATTRDPQLVRSARHGLRPRDFLNTNGRR